MPITIDLSGRHALVTGAGKGIGREICLELARAGADVFAVSRTRDELETLETEVERSGVRYDFNVADIRGAETASRLAAKAQAAIGAIDVLINNAGSRGTRLPRMSPRTNGIRRSTSI